MMALQERLTLACAGTAQRVVPLAIGVAALVKLYRPQRPVTPTTKTKTAMEQAMKDVHAPTAQLGNAAAAILVSVDTEHKLVPVEHGVAA